MNEHRVHRYRVVGPLARGGLGTIYRAFDEVTEQAVALKRLRLDGAAERHRSRVAVAFEREYFTLAQLAHPRVIQVYDYGVDDEGPYYTMELLDGVDLRETAPLPWRAACVVLHDVSSSLALLHSRHLLHRDLSPRNVRCTSDGRAKLIDFGSMAPFGPNAHLMGTPAYMAPEALFGQALDARADLFALGALGYFALTGKHAYPPTRTAEMFDAWRTPPLPLQELVSDLPEALDHLLSSLLSLNPLARPSSAAEVAGRLGALAALPTEDLNVAHACLALPALTAREHLLARWSALVVRALDGQGGAAIVRGAPGLGRTRFVATVGLEAKLAGAVSLHAHGAELEAKPYAVIKALVAELGQQRPELVLACLALYAAALGPLLPVLMNPSLACPATVVSPAEPGLLGARVQGALVGFLIEVSTRACLSIAVDDFPLCDSASASVLAELALSADQHALVLTLSARGEPSDPLPRALLPFAERCVLLDLAPLDDAQMMELLRSVFGDVSHLGVVAEWVQRLSRGNPRMAMDLAQHLVERDIARMQAGVWLLPESLRDIAVPESLEQATEARVAALSAPARRIAQALALLTPLSPLELPEIVELFPDRFAAGQVYAALDELAGAQILFSRGEAYVFRDLGVASFIRERTEAARRDKLHRRIAEAYLRRDDVEVAFTAAYHLLHAGAADQAYALVEQAHAPTDLAGLRSLFSKSRPGIELHEAMLRHAERIDAPKRQLHRRRRLLLDLAPTAEPALLRHARAVVAQLEQDTGLVYLADTDSSLPLHARGQRCVERALDVWEATPEPRRGLHPLQALKELGNVVISLCGVYTRLWDCDGLSSLPRLLAPFSAIRGLAIVQSLVELAIESLVLGHEVVEQRRAFIAELAQPIDGVDTVMRQSARAVVTYYLALDVALVSDPTALVYADSLDQFPSYAALAWHARSIYHACSGDVHEVERCQRRMELFALRDVEIEQLLQVGLIYTLVLAVRMEDLLAVQRLLRGLELEAGRSTGWLPWLRYCRGGYHWLRGELELARGELETGLSQTPPGTHAAWQQLATLLLQVLVDLGQHASAAALAKQVEEAAFGLGLRPLEPTELPISLALAEAHHGHGAIDRAVARLDGALAQVQSGRNLKPDLGLGRLHEARARIALLGRGHLTFHLHASEAADHYRLLGCPGPLGRHERLLQRAGDQQPTARAGASDEHEACRDHETVTDDPRQRR